MARTQIPHWLVPLACLFGVFSICYGGDIKIQEVPFDDFVLILQSDGLEGISNLTIRHGDTVILSDGVLPQWRSRRLYALSFYGYGKQTKTIDIITTGTGTGVAVYHLNRYRLDSEGRAAFLFCRKILECSATVAGPHSGVTEKLIFAPQQTPFDAILQFQDGSTP